LRLRCLRVAQSLLFESRGRRCGLPDGVNLGCTIACAGNDKSMKSLAKEDQL
jgi:hypothetical protein